MEILKLSLICVVALLPMTLLKKYSGEQLILLAIAVAALVIYRCISLAVPIIKTVETIFMKTGMDGNYFMILLRTVGASAVTHLCADLCRDGGSQTLAGVVEIVGTLAILLISLPLIEAVSELLLGTFS